uniref:thioglucosidase n=1 Tax=Brassica oleracea var. oleracea TaxID=109376 RepID=A0A0D3E2F5_BRAOL
MKEEVLQLYVGYLKKMIAMRGRMEYKNVVELMEKGLTVVNFVVCLTNLFKSSHGLWFMLPEALIIDLYTHFMDRDDFGEFAKFAFSEYGHRVKHWITVNEPYESSLGGYDTAEKAPGRFSKYVNEKCVGGEVYTLSHNLLLAHAEAVEEFRKCAKCKDGNIGIVQSPMWFEPYEKKSSSEEIVKRALDFTLGWHLESVTQGDYPLTMKDSLLLRLLLMWTMLIKRNRAVNSRFKLHSQNPDGYKIGSQETLGEKDVLQDALSDSNVKYYHMRHLRTLGGAFRDTCQAYSQNRPTNGRSFLGKVSLSGTSFVPHSDVGILHFPMEKRG